MLYETYLQLKVYKKDLLELNWAETNIIPSTLPWNWLWELISHYISLIFIYFQTWQVCVIHIYTFLQNHQISGQACQAIRRINREFCDNLTELHIIKFSGSRGNSFSIKITKNKYFSSNVYWSFILVINLTYSVWIFSEIIVNILFITPKNWLIGEQTFSVRFGSSQISFKNKIWIIFILAYFQF